MLPLDARGLRAWAMLLVTVAVLIGLARTTAIRVSARLSGAVSGRRVVVDPGHGGLDPGAVGRSGLLEKDLVLSVAFHLRRLLGRAGVYVTLTRETDKDFGDDESGSLLTRKRRDLAYRVDLAHRAEADLYLSIHANSIPGSRWSGAQVFYNANRPYARELAGSIQAALAARLGPSYRLAKPADYRVLNDTAMPAAVVEIGFLSNPEEEALLATDSYQRRVAEAIFEGLLHFFLLQSERRDREIPTMTVPVAHGPGCRSPN